MNTKNLDEKVKEAQREYMRQWRAANREKVRANNARYWKRRAERMAQEREGVEQNG